MKWKKLSSKKVFERPRLNVYEDEVELPSGKRTTYIHFGEMPDASMVIAVNGDGKILLQKEYSYPPDEILYQLPGGLLEKVETPIQGAARELAEEAGLKGRLKPIGWFYSENRHRKQKLHVFIATDLSPDFAEKDPEEMFEDYWFTPEEIGDMIRDGKINNYTVLVGWSYFMNAKL
jgi:ADP-ribose pyrophosphatase